MKLYGLKFKPTNDFMGIRTACTCDGDVSFMLTHLSPEIPMWLVISKKIAEDAAKKNIDWHYATYITPSHDYDYKYEEFEIVEFDF